MIISYDAAMVGYMITVLLCLYGACLFIWGTRIAHQQGWKVSAVYLYVLGLFIGIGYTTVYALVSRYMQMDDVMASYEFRQTFWWITRAWPLNICLALVVGHMSYRAFWQRFK